MAEGWTRSTGTSYILGHGHATVAPRVPASHMVGPCCFPPGLYFLFFHVLLSPYSSSVSFLLVPKSPSPYCSSCSKDSQRCLPGRALLATHASSRSSLGFPLSFSFPCEEAGPYPSLCALAASFPALPNTCPYPLLPDVLPQLPLLPMLPYRQ